MKRRFAVGGREPERDGPEGREPEEIEGPKARQFGLGRFTERVEERLPGHEHQRVRFQPGEDAGWGAALAAEMDGPGDGLLPWSGDEVQFRREPGRSQTEGILLPFVRRWRYAGHLRIQQSGRELGGLIGVRGEAIGTEDVPDALVPGDLHRGVSPGGDLEAPRRRHLQPEHPLVPEVPGASVEVVRSEGGRHQHPFAELEVAVPGRRGLVPETAGQRFAIRREQPDDESGWCEAEFGETRSVHAFDLPLETQRDDVLQEEVHFAGVRR